MASGQVVRANKPNKSQRTLALIVVALLAVIIGLISFAILHSHQDEETTETKQITAYLDAKYGQPFKVKDVSIKRQFLFDPPEIDATVYAVDDPSLTAYTGINRSDPNATYQDNYLELMWAQQDSPRATQALEAVYGAVTPQYAIKYIATSSTFDEKTDFGQVITLQDAIQQYGNNVARFIFTLDDNATTNSPDITTYAQKYAQLVPYVRSTGLQIASFVYNIHTPNGSKYECSIQKVSELQAIENNPNNLSDIINCFKEVTRVNNNA